jgi:hypothetical protein
MIFDVAVNWNGFAPMKNCGHNPCEPESGNVAFPLKGSDSD